LSDTTEMGPRPPGRFTPEGPSTLAVFALWNPVIAAGLAAAGIAGIKVGALQPLSGFMVFVAGAVLGGLVSVLVAAVALFAAHRAGDRDGQRRARLGAVGGIALLLLVFGSTWTARGLPRINDITTDPDDPPVFSEAGGVPRHAGRPMTYPGAEFARQQREAYPDLEPIRTAAAPAEAWRRALDTAETLGWEVRQRDEAAGVIEAWTRSSVFQFVDYVAIRVRPAADGGSVVDIRSASRDGQGDLGANAARIRAFLAAYPR
jgi:uncharacterized protein (DUF1499 family)